MSFNFHVDSDEEEEDPEHATILIVGRSSTGKSSLVRSLLLEFDNWNRTTAVLNDRTFKTKYYHVTWPEALTLTHHALVVEDVVGATPAQFRILAEILSYKVHHDKLNPTLVVTHSVFRTNLFSLLSYFVKIFVTANAANYASFCRLLSYFGYSEAEQRFHQANFKNCKDSLGTHWLINTETREISKVKYPFVPPPLVKNDRSGRRKVPKETAAAASARELATMAKAERFLSAFQHHKEAIVLFEILYNHLKKSTVNQKTLEITLASGSPDGEPVKISLVEYIGSLVDAEQKEPISRDSWRFHRYALAKGVKYPHQLILNKEFLP
jgi:hypothetical protein